MIGRSERSRLGAVWAFAAINIGLMVPMAAHAQVNGPAGSGTQQRLPPGCFGELGRLLGNPDFSEFINKCWLPSAEAGNLHLPPNYARLSFAIPIGCLPDTQNLDQDWRKLERCLLLTIEDKPSRLPNLKNGSLEVWGQSTSSYNCYAYAVLPEHPTNWVGPRVSGVPRPNDIPIANMNALINFFVNHGWRRIEPNSSPPEGSEKRVVLYENSRGFQHAAYWDSRGIFAKMGELGVFRFSSLNQMVGPAFGKPTVMFSR